MKNDDMSLLDHFAGQALVGLLSNPSEMTAAHKAARSSGLDPMKVLAMGAYRYAKAMLAESRRLGGDDQDRGAGDAES